MISYEYFMVHVFTGIMMQFWHIKFIVSNIDVVNHLVSVTFESANRVVCLFVGLQDSQTTRSLSCVIVYGLCQQQLLDSRQEIHGTSTSFSTVVIDLPASIQSGVHCYTVNASNGTFTVLVEGITGQYSIIINPLRMRSRVTVVCLSVCMYVCLSVNALTACMLISAIQTWYYQNRHDT